MNNTAVQKNLKDSHTNNLQYVEELEKSVLLVDDDPSFRSLMEAMTVSSNVKITAFESLHYLSDPRKLRNYDAVIIDYYLGRLNGLQVSQYISTFFPDIPVILISGKNIYDSDEEWPDCIKAFCSKKMGTFHIIQQVEELLFDKIS